MLTVGMQRALGPRIGTLPWRRSRDARNWLAAADGARVAAFERATREAWIADDPVFAFGAALERLLPGTPVFFPGAIDGPPRWTISSLLPGYRGEVSVASLLPRCRGYGQSNEDPFANRPVGLRDLAETKFTDERLGFLVEDVMAPLRFFHQLRSVLYDSEGRVLLYAGYYLPRESAPFDLCHHALLYAAQPALRRWVRAAEVLGLEPIGNGEIVQQLSRVPTPAGLMYRGRVVHLNARGRMHCGGSLERLRSLVLHSARFPLGIDRGELELVLFAEPRDGGTKAVPKYLERTLDMLRDGASDKEIAQRLCAPLSTARTYVQRVLRALGAHDRREIMRGRLM